jgi:hypothetical protein
MDEAMNGNPVNTQHQAVTGLARVHAYACAMPRASWSISTHFGVKTDPKPSPRRFSRIS